MDLIGHRKIEVTLALARALPYNYKFTIDAPALHLEVVEFSIYLIKLESR